MAQTRARPAHPFAVGYTYFAAVLMIAVGGFHAIAGLAGILEDEFYVLGREYVFKFDVTAWGWIHLIGGIIVFLAGLALFSGAVWARIVAGALAIVSIVVSFAWLPWYPFWSALIIALDVLLLWALTVHGEDMEVEHESATTS